MLRLSWWMTSIGSSIVTTCTSRFWLMLSTMPARVVVLPDPVGPVTRTRPRGSSDSGPSTGGRPRSPSGIAPMDTRRNTRPAEPRWRNALTRKRPTPRCRRRSRPRWCARTRRRGRRAGPRSPCARCRSCVRSGTWSRRRTPSTRMRGRRADLAVQVRAAGLHERAQERDHRDGLADGDGMPGGGRARLGVRRLARSTGRRPARQGAGVGGQGDDGPARLGAAATGTAAGCGTAAGPATGPPAPR